jgi:glucose-fructose oxidoreductase
VKDQNNIRLDVVERGGGPLYDIGIYCINASRYLFKAEPVEVFATATKTKDSRFRRNDETISCILKYPEGKIANFTVSFGAFPTADYDLVGTKGRIRLEKGYEYESTMTLKTYEEGKTFIKRYHKRDQFAPELIYFSDCIQRNKKVEVRKHGRCP